MNLKKASAAVGGLGGVLLIVFAFQNCAPEQYFKAQRVERSNSTDGSSTGSSGVSPDRYQITVGELKTTPAAAAAAINISGRMMMVRDTLTGSTESFIHALGLPPSTMSMAHVHDMPCTVASGGGHYKIDYSIVAAIAENEIWPMINMSDATGAGSGYARTNKHFARPEAQSMVIHDAAGARSACGLLHSTMGSQVLGGRFQRLAVGNITVPNSVGSAAIARLGGDNLTVVRVSINGLAPATTYMGHVHNQACASGDGGAHYKQNADVTEAAASANNEIWLMFTTTAPVNGVGGGHGEARVAVPHVARTDAMSVVIHDPVTPTNRLLCVDLALPTSFVSTETGLTRFPLLAGAAKLERLASGQTRLSLSNMAGLTPNTRFMAHLHDRPCHVSAGGGHYKIDYSKTTTEEANEIWVMLNTDATGGGSATTLSNHLARPEAYSVVIHDADGGRLACADVY